MPINPNWFSANAPQMQPGGGGFQEQQPGAVPLPNTGVTEPPGQWNRSIGFGQVLPITQAEQAAVPQMGQMPDLGSLFAGMGGNPFTGLMRARQLGGLMQQAGVPSSGMFGNVMHGAASQLPQALQQQQAIGQMSPYQLMQTAGVPTRGAFGSILGRLMPQAQQAMSGGMGNVLLRAPDGSTKSVPAGEMQHWLGRGAVRF